MQTCPQCGYTEIQKGKQISNVMSEYVQESKPSYQVCLNDSAEEVVFPADEATGKPARKFIRKDIYAARNKPKSVATPAGVPLIPAANTQDKAIGTAIPTPLITPAPAPTIARDAFGNPITTVQP